LIIDFHTHIYPEWVAAKILTAAKRKLKVEVPGTGASQDLRRMIERKMILVAHAGRDPLDRQEVFGTPERFARTVACYPELLLVLAHLGGLRMWDDVRRHLLPAGGNVYFDTAYVSFYMGQEEMGELIKDIGPERVIFGSDYPWEEPGRAAEIIKGLGLCVAEEQAVLGKNAATLLGMKSF